jgi:hypothetical protein
MKETPPMDDYDAGFQAGQRDAKMHEIKIVEKDESMVRLQLDIPDELYTKLIEAGKKDITAEDYASVAITNAVLKGFEKEGCGDAECGC